MSDADGETAQLTPRRQAMDVEKGVPVAGPEADKCCGITPWMRYTSNDPENLYLCTCSAAQCCQTGPAMLFARVGMLIYAIWHTIEVWKWTSFLEWLHSFVYLTDWGALLTTAYFITAVCMQLFGRKNPARNTIPASAAGDGGRKDGFTSTCWAPSWSRGARVHAALFEVVFVLEFVIVIMYWVAIYDWSKDESYDLDFLNNISVHGFFLGFMLVELFISRAQFYFRHLLIVFLISIAYLFVNMGSTLDYKPVYSIMKWDSFSTVLIIIECYVLMGLGFLCGWGLTALRDKVLCKRPEA